MLISLEGISGVGKTFLANALMARLGTEEASLVNEVTVRSTQSRGLDEKILHALGSSGDRFFRMGVPSTETFLLLSLKIYDYETVIVPALAAGQIVIEDRSIHTIAVYQALILNNLALSASTVATMCRICRLAGEWRKVPDVTFLLEDDFQASVSRAERRWAKPYSSDELELLRGADELYGTLAGLYADTILRVDRRKLMAEQIVDLICNRIEDLRGRQVRL